jgi:dimethylargininase
MLVALTRAVPESLAQCELTHLARVPIDVARAATQHEAYEEALRTLGCTVRHVAPAHDLADSVFVEDIAIALDEIAIVTHPGAASRRPERDGVAAVLAEYRRLEWMEAPGTLDGGDVLRVAKTLFVGLSTRTNDAGARALERIVAPHGYAVRPIQTSACLHLKSAVTALDDQRVLCNPEWIDRALLNGLETIAVDPSEPAAANVLRVGDGIICAAAHQRTIEILNRRGYRVCAVDVSELAKAEAGVTCCSVIVEPGRAAVR